MLSIETSPLNRIRQGDVIRNVDLIASAEEKNGEIAVEFIRYPLVYVLSQDCDLEQHHRSSSSPDQDKSLISALVAPLYNAALVFQGGHLRQLNMKMQQISETRSPGTSLKNNANPRYHYLAFPETVQIVPSIIDFKHFFSVTIERLLDAKAKGFECSVSILYREDISQRFASFLARVGLP